MAKSNTTATVTPGSNAASRKATSRKTAEKLGAALIEQLKKMPVEMSAEEREQAAKLKREQQKREWAIESLDRAMARLGSLNVLADSLEKGETGQELPVEVLGFLLRSAIEEIGESVEDALKDLGIGSKMPTFIEWPDQEEAEVNSEVTHS